MENTKHREDTKHAEPATHAGDEALRAGAAEAVGHEDLGDIAQAIICSRQNISPKRLHEPGPTARQIELMLSAAAAAPDHSLLRPWRFVIVPPDKRSLLATVFGLALLDRDPGASAAQVAAAQEKAHRAPFLMLAIARLGDSAEVALAERMVSLGCALQNILLSAHAMGLGAGLTSGQAMRSARMRELFALADDEQAVCCANVGTAGKRKPHQARPGPWEFTSTL